MCLIFIRDARKSETIDWYHLERAHTANRDGFGCAIFTGGRWERATSLRTSWGEVRATIETLEDMGGPYAVHFRYTTKGRTMKSNCHPFGIGRGQWLMHNGTITRQARISIRDGWSDSREVASRLRDREWEINRLHEIAVDGLNRFAVSHPTGKIEAIGDWHEFKGGLYSKPTYSLRETKRRARRSIRSVARRGRDTSRSTPWYTQERFDFHVY